MNAQHLLLNKYGPPDNDHLRLFCEIWQVQSDFPWFPVHSMFINKDFKTKLFVAFTALQKKGIHTEIKTYDGCYNDRHVRGYQTTSLHAWAAALDLNAKDNPMVEHPTPEQRKGSWSLEFIGTMKAAGVFFGGDFIERADPMHFALLDG